MVYAGRVVHSIFSRPGMRMFDTFSVYLAVSPEAGENERTLGMLGARTAQCAEWVAGGRLEQQP